jgi:serine/threonine protein kinase
MTSGHELLPDETGPVKGAADSACPQCGGPRYRGPFGVMCPRCLLAAVGDGDTAESPDRMAESRATNESSGDRSRRFDHFEILVRPDGSSWELGRGSMGVTYRALDIDSLLPVALKVMESAAVIGPVAPAFIFQEALGVAKLQHPNIARLIHFGTGADGRFFLAVELVEGETLQQLVQRTGPVSVSVAFDITAQVVRALMAAGERSLTHGDLKPANIMLVHVEGDERPHVKVLDFGLAGWFQALAGEADRFRGEFRGTPGFASPEQCEGRALDARADFFALGATVYFLLSGLRPDSAASSQKADDPRLARIHFTPLRERGVPEDVIAWLKRLLEPNPARRPKDACELIESFSALRAQLRKSTVAAGSPLRMPTPRWWRRWFRPPVG